MVQMALFILPIMHMVGNSVKAVNSRAICLKFTEWLHLEEWLLIHLMTIGSLYCRIIGYLEVVSYNFRSLGRIMILNTKTWEMEEPDCVGSVYPQADGSVVTMNGISADESGYVIVASWLGSRAF